MGWNGSGEEKVKVKGQGQERNGKFRSSAGGRGRPWRGIVAGLIVVVGGIAAWVMMRGESGEKGESGESVKPSQIAEVAPQVVTNAPEIVVEKPRPIDPNARPTKVGEVVNGYVKLPSGRLHRRTGVITNNAALTRPKSKYEIFERSCNNEIACYLSLKPGDTLVGTPRYNGRFKRDFIKSINEPIVVSPDDSPEDAQLKRDVIAARLQLKDALDRGEDIEQIMLDTRRELQDAMRVKQEFGKMFREGKKACETEQDIEDLLSACNKMLEEKGIAPLTYGPITKRNMLRAQRQEQQQQQQQEEK